MSGAEEVKDLEFYKKFYDENRIAVLQYASLRKHFSRMIDDVLGADYYNMAMDVYDADRICCEDVAHKAKKNPLGIFLNLTKLRNKQSTR